MEIEIKSNSIELVDIDLLIENPDNTNEHPKEQIERLAKIIKHSGFRSPLTVSKRSGFVIAGHGRIEAARNIGMKQLPVIYQEFKNEAEEYAHLNADNEIAKWATTDLAKVNLKMLDFGPKFDIDLMGIKDFVIEPAEKFEPQCDEDAVPEVVHPITRRGDVWLLGDHRVMCGDSTMIDDVEKLMDGEKADMVFTDPPYGVSYQSNMRTKTEKFDVIKNDDEFLDIIPNIELFSKGFVFIWSTWKVIKEWLINTEGLGSPSNIIVWDKGGGGLGDIKRTFLTDWELALVWHRGSEITGKRLGSVWDIGKDSGSKYIHPTQKPVGLAEMALENCSEVNCKILDLFLGSGSTLIACEKTNRKCYGMELDEKYCDVIIKRWEKYTNKKATLELTGETYEELKVVRDATT